MVHRLCWASAQKNRHAYLPAFKLAFMKESRSWLRGCCDCSSLLLFGRKRRCCPRLIVVFQEAKQLLLVGKVSTKMKADTFRIIMLKPVIESLVIAEVKPMLLQLILQVPISLGNEAHVRVRLLNGAGSQHPSIRLAVVARQGRPMYVRKSHSAEAWPCRIGFRHTGPQYWIPFPRLPGEAQD